MSLRQHLYAVIALVGIAIAALLICMSSAVGAGTSHIVRANAAYRQFDALQVLQHTAGLYAEAAREAAHGEGGTDLPTRQAALRHALSLLAPATAEEGGTFEADESSGNETARLDRIGAMVDNLIAQGKQLGQGRGHTTSAAIDELRRHERALDEELQEWRDGEAEEVRESAELLSHRLDHRKWIAAATAIAVCLALGVLALPVLVGLRRSIHALVRGSRILATGDLTARVDVRGPLELRELATAFNDMAEARSQADTVMRDLTREHVRASHRAGMAEIASGVLHNVGNVLNTVNISTEVLAELAQNGRADRLAKVVQLMQEQSADLGRFLTADPRGAKILPYLTALSEHLLGDHTRVLAELATLRSGTQHIRAIVAKQQDVGRTDALAETLEPAEVIEDALALTGAGFAGRGITLIKDYGTTAKLSIDRHKILQIMVNLIGNAKQAVSAAGKPDRLVIVRTRTTDSGGVTIEVEDNGVGIDPANLPRLFTFGFSTKEGGHGFGLHHSALAARELGATLRCSSEGSGHGAIFTLELPDKSGAAAQPAVGGM